MNKYEDRFEINLDLMENGLPPLEGWDEWAKHQVPVSKERAEEIDKALGILRDTGIFFAPTEEELVEHEFYLHELFHEKKENA